jgi:hypothetical protein
MEFLANANSALLTHFPPGIKIILSQLPFPSYNLLLSFALSLLGLLLLILVLRWNPPRHVPEGLKKPKIS